MISVKKKEFQKRIIKTKKPALRYPPIDINKPTTKLLKRIFKKVWGLSIILKLVMSTLYFSDTSKLIKEYMQPANKIISCIKFFLIISIYY